MNYIINDEFKKNEIFLNSIIKDFDSKGVPFGNQDRNSLKLFDLNGMKINVKSFKIPNIINQITYKYFRKSKAQRSFEYANKLKALHIGTPEPIAYYEKTSSGLFKNSYYISKQVNDDLTYRELTKDLNYPNHEAILRAFTRFTFLLHENGIHFLDHSPGNTLIKLNNGNYKFYLVDLNRMNFGDLDFETRIKNFARLTTHKSMVEVMSNEYAKCLDVSYDKVFNLMWNETVAFQDRYYRKMSLKKKLKFWKKF